MAEKEERIWIDYPLPKNSGAIESRRCTTMTRQEAIERMAKALIKADYPHAQEVIWDMRWKEEASKDYYLIMAEAALNALLEGK